MSMNESRNDFGRKPITPKTKKLHPRVDLTAMVSVSFLLIIFFMLTSFLSRSNAMALGMPDNPGCGGYGGSSGCIDGSRVLTILIGKNNKTIVYSGEPIYSSLPPKVLGSEKYSLRKELIEKTKEVLMHTADPKKGLIVIIKPSKESSYGDLVNVLDEMAIVKVPTYAVVNITPEEETLLSK